MQTDPLYLIQISPSNELREINYNWESLVKNDDYDEFCWVVVVYEPVDVTIVVVCESTVSEVIEKTLAGELSQTTPILIYPGKHEKQVEAICNAHPSNCE
jgi:hypothetical protein